MHSILTLLDNNGYVVLLVALMLELLAFPLPGETLMSYCGYLVYKGKLNYSISILLAFLGVNIGVTISYFIGKTLGIGFFNRYGKYVHMGPKRMKKISTWFDLYGSNLLIIAYFIPGVRHITGYFAGITKVSFKKFVINSYIGSFIWTFTFISIGKVLGGKWGKLHAYASKYLVVICIVLSLIVILIIVLKYFKTKIREYIYNSLNKVILTYKSLGRIKILFIVTQFIFLSMVVLIIISIDKILHNEFIRFNRVINYIVRSMFNFQTPKIMNLFLYMSNNIAILIGSLIFVSCMLFYFNNKKVQILSFIVEVLGGGFIYILIERILSMVITRKYNIEGKFLCYAAYISVIFYGYLAFIILEQQIRYRLKTISVVICIVICILIGSSAMLIKNYTASSVIVAYIFGVTWLTINITINQIFKIIKELKK
ncbi:membrane protein DedA, SNARE-associated domain [Clostridium acidisoli DSM 12555]|uniref:Membrane protein DedA, SNARE-associated domain n=1 Tax=Clostridium acidisoli DSM 12555 TaxID=1121291 RepID=A0A1W1XLR2_9CLOT|nr:DedA family protein [Clostridium acidisoli]SMC24784.1 membrane protein DedA, SNARE-associated domain [Clostridium acidisoli DSM 12555]